MKLVMFFRTCLLVVSFTVLMGCGTSSTSSEQPSVPAAATETPAPTATVAAPAADTTAPTATVAAPASTVSETAQSEVAPAEALTQTETTTTTEVAAPATSSGSAIAGVEVFNNLAQEHSQDPVIYDQTPPVGGKHHPAWLNCGVYTVTVPSELAVHSLEHGAVWITHSPDLPTDQVAKLKELTKAGEYRLLSPFPGLPSPIVASAWGLQLKLESVDDPRLEEFVRTYENRKDGPEFGAPCNQAVGEPEK